MEIPLLAVLFLAATNGADDNFKGVAQQEANRPLRRRAGDVGAIDHFFHGGLSMTGPERPVVLTRDICANEVRGISPLTRPPRDRAGRHARIRGTAEFRHGRGDGAYGCSKRDRRDEIRSIHYLCECFVKEWSRLNKA